MIIFEKLGFWGAAFIALWCGCIAIYLGFFETRDPYGPVNFNAVGGMFFGIISVVCMAIALVLRKSRIRSLKLFLSGLVLLVVAGTGGAFVYAWADQLMFEHRMKQRALAAVNEHMVAPMQAINMGEPAPSSASTELYIDLAVEEITYRSTLTGDTADTFAASNADLFARVFGDQPASTAPLRWHFYTCPNFETAFGSHLTQDHRARFTSACAGD
ncbi:MAG: hypothetical protein AAF386_01845 [Pseudomonadota bacterium]